MFILYDTLVFKCGVIEGKVRSKSWILHFTLKALAFIVNMISSGGGFQIHGLVARKAISLTHMYFCPAVDSFIVPLEHSCCGSS